MQATIIASNFADAPKRLKSQGQQGIDHGFNCSLHQQPLANIWFTQFTKQLKWQAKCEGFCSRRIYQLRPQEASPYLAEKVANKSIASKYALLKFAPTFMLSELKSAFQISLMIFLPFLLIDLVVASILTSLGMMMVPPITISLPLKILMFILIDGWNLVCNGLVFCNT